MISISQKDPVRVFVAHAFVADDDYRRIFEYLEGARNFFYRNVSVADTPPLPDREAQRQELRKQINLAEVVLIPAALYRDQREWVDFELGCAKSFSKPVIVLKQFGVAAALPVQLEALADDKVDWDERSIVDAIKRQARHEESTRWDTVEFNLDEFKDFSVNKTKAP